MTLAKTAKGSVRYIEKNNAQECPARRCAVSTEEDWNQYLEYLIHWAFYNRDKMFADCNPQSYNKWLQHKKETT